MKFTENYVTFETAKLLKEKGFNYPCMQYIIEGDIDKQLVFSEGEIDWNDAPVTKTISIPTLQMAMKWIREVGNLFIEIDYDSYETEDIDSVTTQIGYSFSLQKKEKPNKYEYIHDWVYDTYEEAAEEAIKYCLINYVKKLV